VDASGESSAVTPTPIEVEEFLSWLATEKGRAPATLRAYRRDLGSYVAWLRERSGVGPGIEFGQVSNDDIASYVAELRAQGRKPATVARATVSVRSLHRFLVGEGLTDTDPGASIDVPGVPAGLPRALSEESINALLASPVGDGPLVLRDRAMLEVLYGQGLRISELVGLSLADVDLTDRLMRVFGKGSKERIVPIGRHAGESLANWLSGAGRGAIEQGSTSSRNDREAVFLNNRGRRLSRQGGWLVVRTHGDRVGLGRELTPHVLRHSCATHMLDHDADIRTVQEFLGHASISSTQRYTSVSQRRLREVYDRAHPRALGADRAVSDDGP
jgi:integrase/recombinase XerD